MNETEITPWRSSFAEDDLHRLELVQASLPLTADLSRADIMLVVAQGDDAVVIDQAQPRSIASLYRAPWSGRLLPLEEHPAIAAGLRYGHRSKQTHNLLEQGTPVVQQVMPVWSDNGRPLAVMQIETNLIAWERHRRRNQVFQNAVQWLQEMTLRGELPSAQTLSRFGEMDGVLFVDPNYRIRYVSGIANNLYRRLNYLKDLHGEHIGDLHTQDELLVRQALQTGVCHEHQVSEGNRYWTRKVVPVWSYETRWGPLARKQGPKLRGVLVLVHDETEERVKAEELHIKSTMIKEVHHRVKNNLQTVASILRMQSRRSADEELRIHLNEAVNRVLAVAVIHEFLSRDDDQAINIRDVCQRIVTQTQRAAVAPDRPITLHCQGPAIYLPSQQATACALVANELLLNALEHAFQGQQSGSVLLNLIDLGDQVVLEVVDDGVGLPPAGDESDDDPAEGLGLTIINTLVKGDLKGEVTMEPANPGTRVIIRFKKEVGGDK